MPKSTLSVAVTHVQRDTKAAFTAFHCTSVSSLVQWWNWHRLRKYLNNTNQVTQRVRLANKYPLYTQCVDPKLRRPQAYCTTCYTNVSTKPSTQEPVQQTSRNSSEQLNSLLAFCLSFIFSYEGGLGPSGVSALNEMQMAQQKC